MFKSRLYSLSFILLLCPLSSNAAGWLSTNQSLDTLWVAICAILVFFMQAGFALIESGMSRAKNSINVIMKNYADLCIGSLFFTTVGFGFLYGINQTGWFGSSHFFMNDVIPKDYAVLLFQIMFASTAATIASGAMAERTQFVGYLIGAAVICGFIYPVAASWTWGGHYGGSGWLADLGFIDFAGSTVVHSVGGWCALAGIIIVGPRLGRFSSVGEQREIPGHNLMFMSLGGFILWFAWFGFNGGSALGVSDDLGLILLNTHLAAVSGAMAIFVMSILLKRRVMASQFINGALAGLVSITAGCATMEPMFAILTGAVGGVVFIIAERIIVLLRQDDVVSAVAVHGVAGAWGSLAAGLFLKDNLFDVYQIAIQALGISVYFLWAFLLSLVMYFLINVIVGLRAGKSHERRGLDYSEHFEIAYPEFQDKPLHSKRAQ